MEAPTVKYFSSGEVNFELVYNNPATLVMDITDSEDAPINVEEEFDFFLFSVFVDRVSTSRKYYDIRLNVEADKIEISFPNQFFKPGMPLILYYTITAYKNGLPYRTWFNGSIKTLLR